MCEKFGLGLALRESVYPRSRTFKVEEPELWTVDELDERDELEPKLWEAPKKLSAAFRLALTSVVAHELTHVMVRLPRDQHSRRDAGADVARVRDQLYATHPEVEEGAANFIGGLVSLAEAGDLLSSGRIDGRNAGRGRTWSQLWREHATMVESTIGDYHPEASQAYFTAWQGTRFSLRAFGGLFSLLALDPQATDWERTMAGLSEGRVWLEEDGLGF